MENLPIDYLILKLRSMSIVSIVKTCLAVHLEIDSRMIVSYFINRRMQSKLGVLKIITYSYRVSSDTSVDKILIRYASTVYNFLLDLELLCGSSNEKVLLFAVSGEILLFYQTQKLFKGRHSNRKKYLSIFDVEFIEKELCIELLILLEWLLWQPAALANI